MLDKAQSLILRISHADARGRSWCQTSARWDHDCLPGQNEHDATTLNTAKMTQTGGAALLQQRLLCGQTTIFDFD
jgi:hypothetical protein